MNNPSNLSHYMLQLPVATGIESVQGGFANQMSDVLSGYITKFQRNPLTTAEDQYSLGFTSVGGNLNDFPSIAGLRSVDTIYLPPNGEPKRKPKKITKKKKKKQAKNTKRVGGGTRKTPVKSIDKSKKAKRNNNKKVVTTPPGYSEIIIPGAIF